MIEIKERWDERHGMAWTEAWENGYKIDEEYFSVGHHGASVDNQGQAHKILCDRIRTQRPHAHIKSYWTGLIFDGRQLDDLYVDDLIRDLELFILSVDEILKPVEDDINFERKVTTLKHKIDLLKMFDKILEGRTSEFTQKQERFVLKIDRNIEYYIGIRQDALVLLEKARLQKAQGKEYVPAALMKEYIQPLDLVSLRAERDRLQAAGSIHRDNTATDRKILSTGIISCMGPPGSKILIDGVLQPILTPATITNIPVGEHTVTFTRMGCYDYSVTINVVADVVSEARFP
jgi:hypothetical protein